MKCLCCGKELENNSSVCPVDGFYAITMVGNVDANIEKQLEEQAKQKRKDFLAQKKIKVSLVLYEWKVNEEEKFTFQKKDYVSFCTLEEMELSHTYWLDKKYASSENPSVTMNLSVEKNGTAQNEISVDVSTPRGDGLWEIGLSLEAGFTIQLHLRNGQDQTTSELIDVID